MSAIMSEEAYIKKEVMSEAWFHLDAQPQSWHP